jgi:hypothetical protein
MSLTKYEKETIINFNQEDSVASIYTCDEKWIRDLNNLCKRDSRIHLDSKDDVSRTYIIPKKAIKIRLPRLLSASEREKRVLQAKKNLKR